MRRELANLALGSGNWTEAERHGRMAAQLEPENPEQAIIDLALDYRKAVVDEDADARQAVVQRAQAVVDADPKNLTALRIVLTEHVETDRIAEALPAADLMIAAEPDKVHPWLLKLGLLSKLDDDAATESHLNKMVERFPEDQKVHATLASWYVSRDQICLLYTSPSPRD